MHPYLSALSEGLRRCRIETERVLIAVSGGADSVALACGLLELAPEFQLELVVAHLNHHFRGHESDRDAAWVAEFAAGFNLHCVVGDLQSLEPDSAGLEEKARQGRYQFLESTASEQACTSIAVGHTADDQVETVLHHLFRGTGLAGLSGIPHIRLLADGRRVVRPQLAISRQQVEAYLRFRGQAFRRDSSNALAAMTRNRLRHRVLPLLREELNPQVDAAILRLSEQASEIDRFVEQTVDKLLAHVLVESRPEVCYLNIAPVLEAEPCLVRELFRAVWKRQHWPLKAMGYREWKRLAEILHTHETICLPGSIEARFRTETLLVLQRTATISEQWRR